MIESITSALLNNPVVFNQRKVAEQLMKHIDFTVQTQDENVALFKGGPTDHGFDGAKYIFLTDDYMDARIWLIGMVSELEKQRIVQGVMSFLETEISTIDRSHEMMFAH